MTRLWFTLIVVVAVFMTSCGRRADVHWKDGNFKVYATDLDFKATRLGYDHHPGMLVLVPEEVVAAGSTAQFVFVERVVKDSGRPKFYVISKGGSAERHSGTVDGPYSLAQFQEIRASRKLPEFTWRNK